MAAEEASETRNMPAPAQVFGAVWRPRLTKVEDLVFARTAGLTACVSGVRMVSLTCKLHGPGAGFSQS